LAGLAACEGDVGTLQVVIATAPDSTLMADVQRLRVTLTDPETVVEAEKVDGGFAIDLEVVADGVTGYVEIEGFDAADDWIAFGRSGPLPIAAITDTVTVYLAAPMSLDQAPVALDPVRTDMGVTPLGYGVLYAGGRDGDGAPSDAVAIYNVYDHDWLLGENMPGGRVAPAAMAGSQGRVFVFGGADADGADTGDLWFFNTNVAPAGAWTDLGSDATLARSYAQVAPIGGDFFVVTGDPPVLVNGQIGGADAISGAEGPLIGTATSVVVGDAVNTLFAGTGAGPTGATLYALGAFVELESAPAEILRTEHGAAVLADGDIAIAGGRTDAGLEPTLIRYHIFERAFTVLAAGLATPRAGAAVAASLDYLIVAGGRDADDAVVGDVEVFDGDTLEPVTTLPLRVPRAGASAEALPNGQILIAGGVDAAGAPVGVLELFTPDR
jgi:hypothetical protein